MDIYIISNDIQYINELIYQLNQVGIYNIYINMNITSVNINSMLIICNISISEAIIYKIMAENCKAHMIYIHTNRQNDTYNCNIICDMRTNIEKNFKNVNISTHNIYQSPHCIIKMQCGYIVTNVIKYFNGIGILGNFIWSDTIISNIDSNINNTIFHNTIFHIDINKFKGSIQLILPYITDKSIHIIDNSKSYPICTIENFPTIIEHIIEWIKTKINNDLSQPDMIDNSINPTHHMYMTLFYDNIKTLLDVFPENDIIWNNKNKPILLEPEGEYYDEFIKVNNINDFIVSAVKIRAKCYNILIPSNNIILDMYNGDYMASAMASAMSSMMSFVNGLCEIEKHKYIYKALNLYNWDIDMLENKIIRQNIIPAKEIEINGILYNEWHHLTYNIIDTTLENMIIDINIMYGTIINMIIYKNSIIYCDSMNNNMNINIKTLFMERFNINIEMESIILDLIGMDDVLLPLKIEPRK